MKEHRGKSESLDKLGYVVLRRRKALKLSQDKLAERCKVHRTYLADIERGLRNPSFTVIRNIAKGLEMKTSELVAAVEA